VKHLIGKRNNDVKKKLSVTITRSWEYDIAEAKVSWRKI